MSMRCLTCGGKGWFWHLGESHQCISCHGTGKLPVEIVEKETKMKQTMTRRFYKTASAFRRPQILKLYSEAVADAKSEIEKGTAEEYYIVEVRQIVRKKQPEPITVPVEIIEVE